jgi:purine-nucleoside phosphorylase
MAFKKMSIKEIEKWAGIKQKDVPKYLIVDCTWPWSRNIKDVKKYIKNPKPHWKWKYPFFGKHPNLPNVPVGYTIVFSSSMASQLYFFLKLGVKYVFQIGSTGSLQNNIKIFDLIIPKECLKFDWISQQFHSPKIVKCDNQLLRTVENSLKELKFDNYHVGRTVSVASNWIQTPERMEKWKNEGLLCVEQETATIYSICKAFGSKPIGLLRVSDTQRKGERLQDPNRYDEKKNQKLKDLVRDAVLLSIKKLEKV